MSSSDPRLLLALDIAREAGEITLQHFHTDLGFERKSDNSPVTLADREAEQHLRQRILAEFPQDGIVGEEFGMKAGDSGVRWILDPIDGTKSFINRVPLYGTLIGIEEQGQCLAGVIWIPGTGELVYARRGEGAWYSRGTDPARPTQVSQRDLSEGLFVTSQVDSFDKRQALSAFHQVEAKCYVTRTWGDCYGYLLVATGRAEVMIDPYMNLWDAAAVQPILEEAGGRFSDWQGNPAVDSGDGIGTNGRVHEQVIAITRTFPSLDELT